MLRFSLLAAVAGLAGAVALSLIGPAGAATTTVTTVDTSFQPQSVTIDVGDSVQWMGVSGHTVTSSSPNWTINATSDTTYTFAAPGRYAYYCQIHGPSVMSGEVVVVQGRLVALLTAPNESPPTASTGTASVTLNFDAAAGRVTGSWNVTGMTSSVLAAHIHRGAPGINGPIVVQFPGVLAGGGSFSTSNASVDPALIREILADPGGFYVNVHTTTNPDGEVRGPLQIASPCGSQTLGATLSPGSEVPPRSGATGDVALAVDPAAGTIVGTWSVTGASSNIVAAHIHQNAAGANGPIVVPFDGAPASGGQFTTTSTVAPELIANILANPSAFYVNVHTQTNQGGETRGQLACPRTWLPLILRKATGA
jgi:plastocyanin